VLFYHLERQPLERVLPSLLEKTLANGWRAVVQAATPEQARRLDEVLWTYAEGSFLPHVLASDPLANQTPVVITAGSELPNAANVRFLLDAAECSDLTPYRRCVRLFDGSNPDVLTATRQAWKSAKANGWPVTYWQQSPAGKWERKA
jgi:DNA polymerase III subunit chi